MPQNFKTSKENLIFPNIQPPTALASFFTVANVIRYFTHNIGEILPPGCFLPKFKLFSRSLRILTKLNIV